MTYKTHGITIVLIGGFAPTQYSPMWLRHHGLVSQPAADSAKVQIIHPGLCAFSIDNFNLNIEENRFIAATADQSGFERLRDLVQGILTIGSGIPIKMMGINTQVHFETPSVKQWNQVGDTLAPKDFWKGFMTNPGMKSVVLQGENPFQNEGKVQIKVEPSGRVTNGVFVEVNNHTEFKDAKDAKPAVDFIAQNWDKVMAESIKAIENVRGLAK